MGTYMGAYSNSNTVYRPKTEKIEITIKEAECLTYHHYHGSWGEWHWRLVDEEGIEHTVDTWRNYEGKNLIGKKVIIEDGMFTMVTTC